MGKNSISFKIMSVLLTLVMTLSSAVSPIATYAAVPEGDVDAYVQSLPALDDVKDEMDENEIAVAEDLEMTVGDEVDFARDFLFIVKYKCRLLQNKNGSSSSISIYALNIDDTMI